MSIHKIAPIRSEGSPSRCEEARTKERPSVESQRSPKEGEQPRVVYKVRDRVVAKAKGAIVRRAHSALPLTRQRERSETACDVVRRVAREFGKEVHNLFGKSPMCFEPKWDKVVAPFVCVEEVLVVFDVTAPA